MIVNVLWVNQCLLEHERLPFILYTVESDVVEEEEDVFCDRVPKLYLKYERDDCVSDGKYLDLLTFCRSHVLPVTPVKRKRSSIVSPQKYSMESDSDSCDNFETDTESVQTYISSVPDIVKKKRSWKAQYYTCQKTNGQKENLNEHITKHLDILEKNSRAKGEQWRAYSYGKANRRIKALDYKIVSPEQAGELYGIGSRIKEKV